MDLVELRERIPAILVELGENRETVSLGQDAWVVHHGSTMGYVAILGADVADADPVLQVKFRIIRAPTEGGEELFRTLLQLNHEMADVAAFSIDEQDIVWLGAGRFVEDMNSEVELREVIGQTAQLADRYDGKLIEAFGNDLALE
jgi:hypothetical protein